MVARIFCWEPESGLDANSPDLARKLTFLSGARALFLPSPKMVWFAQAVAQRFPDRRPDAVWKKVPLRSLVAGRFLELSISISQIAVVAPFVTEVARMHGLLCHVDLGPVPEPLTEPIRRFGS
jgi:hypothetical protein